MIKIDYDTAVKDVEEIIKGREDYIYVNPFGQEANLKNQIDCMYFDPETTQPSCIVGHVFAKHGLTLEDISEANDNCIMDAADYGNMNIQPTARLFLEEIQRNQDVGVPWGLAYKNALRDSNRAVKDGHFS